MENFCTGTNFCGQNFEILKTYNRYWYRIGTGTGNLWFFLVASEPVSEKCGTEKRPGTSLEKIWYRKKSRNRSRKILVPKKVSEPVSKKFGTEKSPGTGLGKFWYRKKSQNRSRKILVPKKSLGIGIVQILGLVTHWTLVTNNVSGGITQQFYRKFLDPVKRLSEGLSPSHGISQVGYSSHLPPASHAYPYLVHECTQAFGPLLNLTKETQTFSQRKILQGGISH